MDTKSDHDLLHHIDDTQAFTDLFHRYYEQLCFFSEKYLKDKDEAEDVVGDLFTRLWKKQLYRKEEEYLKAFLYRSAYHACLDRIKTQSNSKKRQWEFLQNAEDTDDDYTHNLIRAEVWGELYQALKKLPEQCGKVIELSYIEGKKNAEIADYMGLSMQTVKNYKQRGLLILRSSLSKKVYTILLALYYANHLSG